MTQPRQQPERLEISLWENGRHSFQRGLEFYERYTRTNDKMLLKDAIMFLHHAVELLMKQILVQHSEYLIFEDLKSMVTKQKDADARGVGIFYLPQPPKTISCDEAIRRVDALIRPPELDKPLVENLAELIRVRNQLEHYAIAEDREKVVRLLADLLDPLLTLFETRLGQAIRPPAVQRVRAGLQSELKEYQLIEEEVDRVMKQFKGQEVPARLFNLEGVITLPAFIQTHIQYRLPGTSRRIDVLAEGSDVRWVVEVKRSSSLDSIDYGLEQLRDCTKLLTGAVPWLITFGDIDGAVRRRARGVDIMLTGAAEWQELKKLIEAP